MAGFAFPFRPVSRDERGKTHQPERLVSLTCFFPSSLSLQHSVNLCHRGASLGAHSKGLQNKRAGSSEPLRTSPSKAGAPWVQSSPTGVLRMRAGEAPPPDPRRPFRLILLKPDSSASGH